MSLISDFEMAWKPFEDKLTSYVVKHSFKNEIIELDDLISFYNRSVRMWEDPSRVQCGFLSKWKGASTDLERDFMEILQNFRFQEPVRIKKVSAAIYVMATLVVTFAGAIVGYLLPKSNFLKLHLGNVPVIIIGAVVFAVAGGGIIKALYDNAVTKTCKEVTAQYTEQIESLHIKLQTLCKQVS